MVDQKEWFASFAIANKEALDEAANFSSLGREVSDCSMLKNSQKDDASQSTDTKSEKD